MNSKEARSIVQLVRDASVGEIAFVSFLILPLLLGAWSALLNTTISPSATASGFILIGVAMAYVAAVGVMKFTQSKDYEVQRRRDELMQFLARTKTRMRKFATVRKRLGNWYSDDRITLLIKEFPNQLWEANFEDGGVALIEDTEEEEDA